MILWNNIAAVQVPPKYTSKTVVSTDSTACPSIPFYGERATSFAVWLRCLQSKAKLSKANAKQSKAKQSKCKGKRKGKCKFATPPFNQNIASNRGDNIYKI
jgi:hypothetical protein